MACLVIAFNLIRIKLFNNNLIIRISKDNINAIKNTILRVLVFMNIEK